MELLLLCLVLMGALLISAALEPFLPRVSLPLVQILIGILLYFFVKLPADFNINSDLFLVLFIAPLLFDESRNADNRELWKHKGSIVSLAIGLVFITLLIVGFMLHWIAPSVPLAAAFALGAALGPASVVTSALRMKCLRGTARMLVSGSFETRSSTTTQTKRTTMMMAVTTSAMPMIHGVESAVSSIAG